MPRRPVRNDFQDKRVHVKWWKELDGTLEATWFSSFIYTHKNERPL